MTTELRKSLVARKAELLTLLTMRCKTPESNCAAGDESLAHTSPTSESAPCLIDLSTRVEAFQKQKEEWRGFGVPLLTLPGSPTPQSGWCVSCGEPIPERRWRCRLCLRAVYIALKQTPPEEAEAT